MTRQTDLLSRRLYALGPARTRARRPRLVLQSLEDRTTPAQFLVTSAADSGTGTLREAVDLANASATADEIVFDTANLFADPQTIFLADRLLALESGGPLTITGPGKDRLTVDGNDSVEVLRCHARELTLTGFTIANAFGTGNAGAIFSYGVVRLDGMVIRDCEAGGSGGGIFMAGDSFLHVRNSTISGNSAGFAGGGIYMYYNGSLVVENCTISGNSAVANGSYGGGGIHFWGDASTSPPAGFTPGALVIRNSTISGNSITGSGGGINLAGFDDTLRVENSTITGNTATGFGGGIRLASGGGTIVVANSVVAGNTNGPAPDIRSDGTVNADHGAFGSTTGFTPSAGSNYLTVLDPMLGQLLDNGGPTFTMAPQAGSPLINAGPTTTGVQFDQRGSGFVRTYGPATDIGAVEVQPIGLPFAVPNLPAVTTAGATTHAFTVTYRDETGTAATGINVSTVIGNDAAIRVTGPNGFDVPATYVSIDIDTDGSPRTVTYAFTPPGGAWDPTDSGAYRVNILADAVKDVEGNAVPAGPLGELTVGIPRTLVVTTAADAGTGSLREAIGLANASPAADEIVFDTAGVFSAARTISLASALPEITAAGGPLTIAGPGKDRLTVDGNNTVRGLSSAAPELTLTGFTIARGATTDDGAGIRTGGLTTLDGMVIRDSHADNYGGGIWRAADAFLAVRNSTISGNSSPYFGGGIYTGDSGGLVVENSTVSGNTVVNGGQFAGYYGAAGIFVVGTPSDTPPSGFAPGAVVIRNSTIANNSTDGSAGGIGLVDFDANLLVESSTISGNVADKTGSSIFGLRYGGGGIRGFAGNVVAVITNSVVSGNMNAGDPDDLFFDLGQADAFNSAFGDGDGYVQPGDGNLIGEDYLLGPLQDNGGPTFTMAPLAGSPLLNAGDSGLLPAGLDLDQRGLGRVVGPAVDIGAVETQPPAPSIIRAPQQADPTNGTTVAFDVAFGMPVTGFDAADVSLDGTTAPGTPIVDVVPTGSTTYRVTVSGFNGSGIVVASVREGAATDPNSGLTSLASTGNDGDVTIDLDAPTVAINQAVGQSDPTTVSPIAFDVVFSEPIVGFTAADVLFDGSTVGGTPVAAVAQTGSTTYRVTVTGMTGLGTVVASVPAGAVTDPAGNDNTVDSSSTDNEVLFGEEAPTVTINRATGQDDPTSRTAITFDVVFSEPVTGFDGADVSLAGSTALGPLAAAVTGSGATYTVTVIGMSGRGSVVASVPSAVVTDLAGIPNVASTSTDNSVEFLQAGVVSVSTASQTTDEGTVLTFTVSRTGGSEGDVSVKYATVAGTANAVSEADYTPKSGSFTWDEGETHDQSFTVTIHADGANEGREHFAIALTDPDGGVQVGTPAFGMAIAPSDGAVVNGTDKKPQVVFTDADGDLATIKLTGMAGTMTVFRTDPDGDGKGPIELIELANTTIKSAVSITVKKPRGAVGPDNGQVSLGGLTGTDLKGLTAKFTDLVGPGITLTGNLGVVILGDIKNGADIKAGPLAAGSKLKTSIAAKVIEDGTTIDVDTRLAKLSAWSIGDGAILAPSAGTIQTVGNKKAGNLGDFKSDVTLDQVPDPNFPRALMLNVFKVKGAVVGSTISVKGNVGAVTVGSFWNSRLDAGYTGANNGSGVFDTASSIGPFNVTAKTAGFQNSYVIATTIKPVTLASVTEANGGIKFGFIAKESLVGLRITAPAQRFTFDPTQPSPQPQGRPNWDFEAIDLTGP